MNRITAKERQRLAIILAMNWKPTRERLIREGYDAEAHIATDVTTICRAAHTISYWCLAACNGIERYDAKLGRRIAQWNEDDEAKAEREIEKAGKAIDDVLRNYAKDPEKGIGAWIKRGFYIQRDPRGWNTRVRLKHGSMWGF